MVARCSDAASSSSHQVHEWHSELSPATREILSCCEKLLVQAWEEYRRTAHNPWSTDLDHLGLPETRRNLDREIESRTNLTVRRRIARLAERLPLNPEVNRFRIVHNAVNNIEKHAKAMRVSMRLVVKNEFRLLKMGDDGLGAPSGDRGRGQAWPAGHRLGEHARAHRCH